MDSHEIMQRIANSRIVFRDSFRDLEHFYNTINKDEMMLSRLVDTFFSRTSWTMLLYAENHSISVA